MRFNRRTPLGVPLKLVTDSDTVVRHEAYGEYLVGVAHRIGNSAGEHTIYAIGDGFAFDEAVETALAALMDRFDTPDELAEDRFAASEDSEPSWLYSVNGCEFEFDTDHEWMLVSLGSRG